MAGFRPLPAPDPAYARRLNFQNDCVESVCRYCFQTVASALNLDALTVSEQQHQCPAKPHSALEQNNDSISRDN